MGGIAVLGFGLIFCRIFDYFGPEILVSGLEGFFEIRAGWKWNELPYFLNLTFLARFIGITENQEYFPHLKVFFKNRNLSFLIHSQP